MWTVVHRRLGALLLALCANAWLCASARADAPFEIGPALHGEALGTHMGVLRDPTGALDIHAVSSPAERDHFKVPLVAAPSYGLDDASFWIRLTVRNPSARQADWLLELGYPHLDWVELYAPRPDGSFDVKHTGDNTPFDTRDLESRMFVFKLSEPAQSQHTYYLRVRTWSSVSLPLRAWSADAYHAHEARELPMLWMFYGVILVMAVYNLFLFFSSRMLEYLHYSLYNLSFLLMQFTLNGHAFQYVLRTDIFLVNHVLPFSIGLTFIFVAQFARYFLCIPETIPWLDRYYRILTGIATMTTMFGLLGPYRISVRIIVCESLLHIAIGLTSVVILLRRNYRPVRYYTLAWVPLMIGAILFVLKTAAILPSWPALDWSFEIGATLEVVLLSFALADRINSMRNDLAVLNGQLSHTVDELKGALHRAEAGTRAKSEFLATMSHELRTPLNAIINIPQGLLAEFPSLKAATCSSCSATFELEADDAPITAETLCPDCSHAGTLQEKRVTEYRGRPEHTAQHLAIIERAGRHLLQMVNGVLDFSKIEAQALRLHIEPVQPESIVNEAVETVSELAVRAGLTLALDIEPGARAATLHADALRVKQILINLLGNAIKFSPQGARVTVAVHATAVECVFTVVDQGIGIPKEDLERVFEQFEQVERGDTRKYGGTGLGLSISRSLVQLHGGAIWAESEVGQGSTFGFRLPLTGPAPQPAAPRRASVRPVSLAKELHP